MKHHSACSAAAAALSVVPCRGLVFFFFLLLQYEELAPFAARVQGLKLSAWEISTCLREIMVETVIGRQIEVRLYSKASGLVRNDASNAVSACFLVEMLLACRITTKINWGSTFLVCSTTVEGGQKVKVWRWYVLSVKAVATDSWMVTPRLSRR